MEQSIKICEKDGAELFTRRAKGNFMYTKPFGQGYYIHYYVFQVDTQGRTETTPVDHWRYMNKTEKFVFSDKYYVYKKILMESRKRRTPTLRTI